MSTPVVAGAVALARQYFVEGWYPTGAAVAADAYTPSGPLLKAVILGESTNFLSCLHEMYLWITLQTYNWHAALMRTLLMIC